MLVASSQSARRRTSRFLSSLALGLSGLLAFYLLLHNYRVHASAEKHWVNDGNGMMYQMPPVAADPKTQNMLEAIANKYTSLLTQGDFMNALKLTYAPFREHQTPENFRRTMEQNYQPFTQNDLHTANKFGHAHLAPYQAAAMLNMELHCRNGASYISMVAFTREGSGWRISNIMPPIHLGPSNVPDFLLNSSR